MHRGGELRNGAVAAGSERLRRVAGGTQHRFAVSDHAAVETLGIEAAGGKRRGVESGMPVELMLIMEAQDVEAEIPLLQPIPNPAGSRHRGGLSAGGMAGAAVHFVGNRQHNIVRCEDRATGIAGDEAHEWIGVFVVGVIVGRDRDAFGAPPVHRGGDVLGRRVEGLEEHALGRIAGAWHGPGHGQTLFRGEGGAKKRMRVCVVVALAHGGGIE